MDGNGNMNFRNWGFLEPPASSMKNQLGLQLITSMAEKPLFGGGGGGFRDHQNLHPSPVMSSINGGPFHHHRVGGISESHIPVDYWMNQSREKYLNVLPVNHQPAYYQSSYGVSPESSSAHSVQMPQQFNLQKAENVMSEMEEMCEEKDDGGCSSGGAVVVKKRGGSKVTNSTPKEKKPRTRTPRPPRDEPTPPSSRARIPKKRAEIVINGINMDISEIPIPVCSCTGAPQQCYRWGSGGWQSACCTTHMSEYPLPPSDKRRGARIAGRKMSIGAFKKVLEKLASEGYNFSSPIDLRSHWAKHGTNKFVTIR
ncbi:protein BASIC PENTACYSTEINE2-like [Salvia miltiorrhiza]|uniref:protein BASIC PENTACYSTEINE2-like n=1 Tax=Salvia miltiorrhiza TaxID=226208 RepID=UPI0025AC3BF5|nr:protein BASIC PENTACYSTEINE2-like [Salvia miltiorrhiza]